MAKEGLITKSQALMSLKPDLIDQLLHPTLDPKAKKEVIAKGLPASPGAAGGKVVFSADEAVRRSKDGDKVILVRIETSPDDIHGLHAAEGVLTTRGIWRNGVDLKMYCREFRFLFFRADGDNMGSREIAALKFVLPWVFIHKARRIDSLALEVA